MFLSSFFIKLWKCQLKCNNFFLKVLDRWFLTLLLELIWVYLNVFAAVYRCCLKFVEFLFIENRIKHGWKSKWSNKWQQPPRKLWVEIFHHSFNYETCCIWEFWSENFFFKNEKDVWEFDIWLACFYQIVRQVLHLFRKGHKLFRCFDHDYNDFVKFLCKTMKIEIYLFYFSQLLDRWFSTLLLGLIWVYLNVFTAVYRCCLRFVELLFIEIRILDI